MHQNAFGGRARLPEPAGELTALPQAGPLYAGFVGWGKRWIRIARERDREKGRWEGNDEAGRRERQ